MCDANVQQWGALAYGVIAISFWMALIEEHTLEDWVISFVVSCIWPVVIITRILRKIL